MAECNKSQPPRKVTNFLKQNDATYYNLIYMEETVFLLILQEGLCDQNKITIVACYKIISRPS